MTPKQKNKKKKKVGQWGKGLGGVYRVVSFIHRHRIFKLFKPVPHALIMGVSHLFSKFFFGRSKTTKSRIIGALEIFSGKKHSKRFQDIFADLVIKHMAILLFDIMLKAPNYDTSNYQKLVKWEGLEYLDAALEEEKGVLVPSIHVGHFFHAIAGILLHSNQYEVAGVGNMANRLVFENVAVMPQYKNIHVVPRDKYSNVKKRLVHHLNKNRIVFLMHDMGRGENLQTYMVEGQKEIFVPTPQGIIALHIETGAPIVPIVAIPDGRFISSTLKFLDPSHIREVSKKFKDKPREIIHGELSLAINKILFPYLLKYLHCWEEIMRAGGGVDVRIRFKKGSSMVEIINQFKEFFEKFIKSSYERTRDDLKLLEWLEEGWQYAKNQLNEKEQDNGTFKLKNKSFVRLCAMKTKDQVLKSFKVLESLFKQNRKEKLYNYFKNRENEIKGFFGD